MEAMVKAQHERPGDFIKFITCPSEMVALSIADGYARVTGQPQAVIIHVDVGTQALGCAIHNASVGRVPVLIFAGLSPCTMEGEYRGSRTEFIHWLQDVPDQKSIVAQYCRYTGEIRRSKNIKQIVNRALSFAKSGPAGPVYLQGTREVMEEVIEPYTLKNQFWNPVELGGLSDQHLNLISRLLLDANEPLVITGYSGRNVASVPLLVKLADVVKGLRVLDTMGSDLSFPADHPGWLSVRYGSHPAIETADVILVIDCDVPWINTQCKPREDAKIVHLDVDPLKQQMPLYYIDALLRLRVSSELALRQIVNDLEIKFGSLSEAKRIEFARRWSALQSAHKANIEAIAYKAESRQDVLISPAFLFAETRKACPSDTIWVVEAVTETATVADQLQATLPGSLYSSGAGGLGWSGGAAIGIKLATDAQNAGAGKFVCQIVGDGCFMFSVPSSVFWIAQRYKVPVLTIVINNNGNIPTSGTIVYGLTRVACRMERTAQVPAACTPEWIGLSS